MSSAKSVMECTGTLKSVLGFAEVIAVPSLEGTIVLKNDTVNPLFSCPFSLGTLFVPRQNFDGSVTGQNISYR